MANEFAEKETIPETPESLYEAALSRMERGQEVLLPSYKEENYRIVADKFKALGDFKDAPVLEQRCRELADEAHEEDLARAYEAASARVKDEKNVRWDTAAQAFEALGDYRDAKAMAALCREREKQQVGRSRKKTVCVLAIVAVCLILLIRVGMTGGFRYLLGLGYRQIEQYTAARSNFEKAGNFPNAPVMAKKCEALALRTAERGKTVSFGDLSWKVLEPEAGTGSLLLIAATFSDISGLSSVPFDQAGETTSWEGSSLRDWLGGAFLEEHFDERERGSIPVVATGASVNPQYGTVYEACEGDRVTILSCEEMETYADVAQTLAGDWWLRTPGFDLSLTALVTAGDQTLYYGTPADTVGIGVHPVLRVDLNTLEEGL